MFDEILPKIKKIFDSRQANLKSISPILINRDLKGRVRLILDKKWESDPVAQDKLSKLTRTIKEELSHHAYPPESALLFESNFSKSIDFETKFPLAGVEGVWVVDRLATEGNWATIERTQENPPRVVFYSIKGGVGRSTALAATAWAWAERGKRILVLDLDLESPGLSSSLLPEDRRPAYGITDWLVEDLVENGSTVLDNMVATSSLSRNGDVFVVPAHGAEAGEYVAKLGRVWMPKVDDEGNQESWSRRLRRLLVELERLWEPDVTLIDSRAGIDEVASTCLTDLSAATILLFAIDGDQTWSGYRILFRHWRLMGVEKEIRDRLQVVGAMIPELGAVEYFKALTERSWDLFSDELYDEVPAGAIATEGGLWSFDESDESASHYPFRVRWNRDFTAVKSLHGLLPDVDDEVLGAIFGPLIDGLAPTIEVQRGTNDHK